MKMTYFSRSFHAFTIEIKDKLLLKFSVSLLYNDGDFKDGKIKGYCRWQMTPSSNINVRLPALNIHILMRLYENDIIFYYFAKIGPLLPQRSGRSSVDC